MNNQEHLDIVATTKKWIKMFVINLKLCPFASLSFDADKICYGVCPSGKFPDALQYLHEFTENNMDNLEKDYSNSFVILPQFISFLDTLDLQAIFNSFLASSGKSASYQTVVFHPEFKFEGEADDAHGNFVNRAPYPMIHILRVDEVSRALASLPNADEIPERNKELLEMLKVTSINEIFTDDFQNRVEQVQSKMK